MPILTESTNALAHVSRMAKVQYNRNIPEDIDVIELPDNISWHYLVYLDCILDLVPGEAEKMVR